MRILLIRHGDPNYEIDSLTEKGWKEVKLLAERLADEPINDFYVSPLGRARDTASCTLEKKGKSAKTLEWLKEFPSLLDINESEYLQKAYPDTKKKEDRFESRIPWDMLPGYWKADDDYLDPKDWKRTPSAAGSVVKEYERVTGCLDELLAEYGYIRNGNGYRTEKGNEDTICLFCHFGISCVLLSHLWNISPFILWHSFVMAPSSVTELYTEEREQGIVHFRATKIGDTSHLFTAKEPPAFAARFCETFENMDQRH